MTIEALLKTPAVVIEAPGEVAVRELELEPPGEADVLVEIDFSGISTGTERLLWSGRMPPFPGLGYPLVPGYESVGRVIDAGPAATQRIGETVFVPGSSGFRGARGLFGGAARRVVTAAARVVTIPAALGEKGALLALAATAEHALVGGALPDLIVGHGVLGRLLARLAIAKGGPAPTVWETNPVRAAGAQGYQVIHPDADPRRDYRAIQDVSGDASLLDALIGRLARGGEIVLAGFYESRLGFDFPAAFMREARLRIAAEFTPADLRQVLETVKSGALDLEGLITHRAPATEAATVYGAAFGDPECLKLCMDWRNVEAATASMDVKSD
jgi:3-hydroxyethyl bacteriochlorophyllide a dehydrogenase